VSSRIYSIFTVREGKVARYREFYDEKHALEAVGLTA
jgi:ketosteroid isomerase-like protein